MSEATTRLSPSSQTLRELYLSSGNECAFAGCDRRMIDTNGIFVGVVCHIEAAMLGGERFNARSSNEERRLPANLILMCPEHHTVTNDVVVYPVDRMRRMKSEHETIYRDLVRRISASLIDYTEQNVSMKAINAKRFTRQLKWDSTSAQMKECISCLESLAERLSRVPRRARELLAIIITRGQLGRWSHDNIVALHPDIAEACEMDNTTIDNYLAILHDHDFTSVDFDEEARRLEIITTKLPLPIWIGLKEFCDATDTPIKDIVVEGRFNLLDD